MRASFVVGREPCKDCRRPGARGAERRFPLPAADRPQNWLCAVCTTSPPAVKFLSVSAVTLCMLIWGNGYRTQCLGEGGEALRNALLGER